MTAAREPSRRAQRPSESLGLLAALVLAILASIAGAAVLVVCSLPALQPGEAEVLRAFPPRSLAGLRAQGDVLLAYAATSPRLALLAYACCYVLLQACAVPGTLSLSVLAGALYGVRAGLALVAVVSTLGSCACYGLSRLVGRQLVLWLWPDRVDRFAAEVAARRAHLLNYVVFLRVTPLLPNTFINVASPMVGVPLVPFALGTLLGCMPNNFVAVSAGSRLGELRSMSDLYDRHALLVGAAAGLMALLPVLLKGRAQPLMAPAPARRGSRAARSVRPAA